MNQIQKLDSINQKIAELSNQKKAIEEQIVLSVSKQVAAMIIKKHVTNIDVPKFLKKIEEIINEMNEE
jgi:uncharacterized protein YpiB (UPF0302 family)